MNKTRNDKFLHYKKLYDQALSLQLKLNEIYKPGIINAKILEITGHIDDITLEIFAGGPVSSVTDTEAS